MNLHRAATLASSVAGAVIVALDGTVLTVAQPALQRDLSASFAQVQWTSTGYLVAVASLLVFSGRLGDAYGHHRVFALGMLGFGAASAGIGLTSGVGWVIGLRVVQGVFGALLQPATLGMLRAAYPPDRLRTPIAVRTGAIGLAAAAGPVLGGVLVSGPGWRAVFFLNVVPALVFGLLALTLPAARSRPSPARLDIPGAVLLAATLACLVHVLVQLPHSGWTLGGEAFLVLVVVTGAAFVRHERRTASPLVPPDVVGSAAVTGALTVLVIASAALHGTLFVATFVLQDDLGYDPLHMALLSLPLAALMILAAPSAAVLLRRVGPRRTTVAATAVLAAGIVVLGALSGGAVSLCTGFGLLGAGFGTVMVTATHVVVRQSAAGSAGVAGGLQQTAMNVGPVLGVAVAATLGGLGHGYALPLYVLALVAAVGAVAGRVLPERSVVTINHVRQGDRARLPARG
ncbi:MFS transporter [Streptomyces sp. NBC_00588]|uniref:MFS transporter n=1 Tax=Streptomyces sp. NBC_00588 TaxID=2975784 RepID=UPI002E7FBFED|nr:MFS transporter [Streptomyces sp. NBC_00588]WUB34860.1 MFS transporter [Streptomyces sp. NBC_00588]